MGFAIRNIGIDTNDLDRAVGFWQAATGYVEQVRITDYVLLADPEGRGVNLLLQLVPEPRTGKNRLHLDLTADDAEAAATGLERLGATRLRRFDEPGDTWIVLHDPDGNAFCVCQSVPKIPDAHDPS